MIETRPGQGRALTRRTISTAREADLTPQRQGVPDDPIPLPDGWLACLACGVAVAGDAPALVVEPQGRVGAVRTLLPGRLEVRFGRCPACTALTLRAEHLAAGRPALVARLGDTATTVYRVESGLQALDALGLDAHADIDVEAVLRHLTRPGAGARWSARFFPLMDADADPRTCSPHPWSHVRLGRRAALRDGYAALLEERVARTAPPVALAQPAPAGQGVPLPGGCLLCGVGQVALPAAQVVLWGGREAARRAVWHALTTTPSSLGGGSSPERVSGHTCPACSDALAWVGAVGPTAMERALAEHLRATGHPDKAERLSRGETTGLAGWGGIAYTEHRRGRPAAAPNASPWDHVTLRG